MCGGFAASFDIPSRVVVFGKIVTLFGLLPIVPLLSDYRTTRAMSLESLNNLIISGDSPIATILGDIPRPELQALCRVSRNNRVANIAYIFVKTHGIKRTARQKPELLKDLQLHLKNE